MEAPPRKEELIIMKKQVLNHFQPFRETGNLCGDNPRKEFHSHSDTLTRLRRVINNNCNLETGLSNLKKLFYS